MGDFKLGVTGIAHDDDQIYNQASYCSVLIQNTILLIGGDDRTQSSERGFLYSSDFLHNSFTVNFEL